MNWRGFATGVSLAIASATLAMACVVGVYRILVWITHAMEACR